MFLENRMSDGLSGTRRACSFLWTPPEPTLDRQQLNTQWNRFANLSGELKTCGSADPKRWAGGWGRSQGGQKLAEGERWVGRVYCYSEYPLIKLIKGHARMCWVETFKRIFCQTKIKCSFTTVMPLPRPEPRLLRRWLGNLWTCARNWVTSA